MSDERKPANSYEIFLKAREAVLEAELAAVRANLLELSRIGHQSAVVPADTEDVLSPRAGLFRGLPLTDAAAKFLELSGDRPQTVKQIWAALKQDGFEILSGHPTRAVGEALRKRLDRERDVFCLGNGRWGATKNFSRQQIKRINKRFAGLGGRKLEEHVALTKTGMAAARAEGKQIGASPKLTAESVARIKRLLAQGTPKTRASAAIGISLQTFYNNRDRIERWKEGEPWPPPGVPAGFVPRLKVVK